MISPFLKNLYPANAVSFFENRNFLTHHTPARPRGNLCVDTIGSPDRGILFVNTIRSPGKPALPLWPLMLGLMSKLMLGLMLGLIRKNRLPARIRGWAGTATGRHIHVVHISHTHPPKELIQTQRICLLGKKVFLFSLSEASI